MFFIRHFNYFIAMASEVKEFLARVRSGGRITIPLAYRKRFGLEEGALVWVTVKKDEGELSSRLRSS